MKITIEGTEEEIRRVLERIGEHRVEPVPEQPIWLRPSRTDDFVRTGPEWLDPLRWCDITCRTGPATEPDYVGGAPFPDGRERALPIHPGPTKATI